MLYNIILEYIIDAFCANILIYPRKKGGIMQVIGNYC